MIPMRLSAQRIEVTPTGLAALHRTLPVVGPHGRKLTCKCGAPQSVNGHLRASRDIPTVGFDGGLLVNLDLCIVDERPLPRDVAEKAINIMPKAVSISSSSVLLHEPAMTDNQRLAGERVGLGRGKEQNRRGDVLDRGELVIHCLA